MIRKFAIYCSGGLGDSIKRYFGHSEHGDGWEYLYSIKEKYPDAYIKLFTFSSNPQTSLFYKYHPLINEIEEHKWVHPQQQDQNYINKITNGYELLKYANRKPTEIAKNLPIKRQNQLYLSHEDEIFINDIKNNHQNYVVIHPFATDRFRRVIPITEFNKIIDHLIFKKYTVFIIGANYINITNKTYNNEEKFDYAKDGLINLIDKINARVAARLILGSNLLISFRSFSFALTKSGLVKKSILLTNKSGSKSPKRIKNQLMSKYFGWSQDKFNNIKIFGFTDNYKEDINNLIEEIDE